MKIVNPFHPRSVESSSEIKPAAAAAPAPKAAPTAARPDGFVPVGLTTAQEKQMDIVCPLMGALVAQGHVKLDSEGRMKTKDFYKAMVNVAGISKPMALGAMAAAPTANKKGDILGNMFNMRFNPLLLRSGNIKHPNDSAILTKGKFDEAKFQALIKHAKDGKMTIPSFSAAISATVARDGTDSGVKLAVAEAAALINVFGTVDPRTKERSIDIATLRNLYEKKELPPEGLMMSRPPTGIADMASTMSRIQAGLAFGNAAGVSNEGVNRSIGAAGSMAGTAMAGAGKASCPHMKAVSDKAPPTSVDALAALHQ
jgi:hypothetical protein